MISARRLLAMTWARSLEFLRDRAALGWNLFFPLMMVIGFAVVFSGPGRPLFNVGVLAEAPLNGDLHPFLATPQVRFYVEQDPQPAAVAKVARHRIDLLLDLRPGQQRYWINEQSPRGELLERLLHSAGGASLVRMPMTGAPVRYVDWVVPGLLGLNMTFSCLFGIGYVIVRYRKNGYLKRLNATPLNAMEFVTAQLLSRLVLILVITAGVYGAVHVLLDLRMDGSYLALFLVTLLGAFAMIALGLVVSARVTSEELAAGILNVLSWPMLVLSGVFFSLDGAPQMVRWAAEAFPLTHLLDAARAIMLDGAGLVDVAPQLAVLAGMSLLFLTAGARLFRWTPD